MEEIKKRYLSQEPPTPAKNSFEYEIDRMKDRALLSPIIAERQAHEINMLDYVTYHPIGAYIGNVAVVVAFGECAAGGFYPEWIIQSSVFVSDNKPLRLKSLQNRHLDALIDICNRIVESCEMADDERNVAMKRTKFQYEWRLPLSEGEVQKMDKVFQELIRRRSN